MGEPNEQLRRAMAMAHIDTEAVAEKVGVDPKTVRRWLGGRQPHARHRWAVAELLAAKDEELWPGANVSAVGGMSVTGEILAAYAHRADVPLSVWANLLDRATERIDLLAYAALFFPEQHPRLAEILREKTQDGCEVRILLGDPDCMQVAELDKEEGFDGTFIARVRTSILLFREQLTGIEGIDIRYHSTPLYNSIYRYDDEMLVNPHLYGNHAYQSPVYHLRHAATDGLFDNYARSLERVWESAAREPTTDRAEGRADEQAH